MAEEERFLRVCLIARDKLNDMADSIISNRNTITLGEIREYWEYYKNYDSTCIAGAESIKRKLKKEGEPYIR